MAGNAAVQTYTAKPIDLTSDSTISVINAHWKNHGLSITLQTQFLQQTG